MFGRVRGLSLSLSFSSQDVEQRSSSVRAALADEWTSLPATDRPVITSSGDAVEYVRLDAAVVAQKVAEPVERKGDGTFNSPQTCAPADVHHPQELDSHPSFRRNRRRFD